MENRDEGTGCLKVLLVVGAVVLVICALVGFYVYMHAGIWMRSGVAAALEFGVESVLKELEYPADEAMAINKTVKQLGERIRRGEASLEQGSAMLAHVAGSSAFVCLLARVFEVKHLEGSGLGAEEKDAGGLVISRFVYGLARGRISRDVYGKLQGITHEQIKKADGSVAVSLKATLDDAEVREVLRVMKQAADEAQIENQRFSVDLAQEIAGAIERGLRDERKGQGAGKSL